MERYHSNLKVRLIPILCLFILVALTGCDVDINEPCRVGCTDYSASESFEYGVNISNQNSFGIYGINGPIDITGGTDSNSVEIWGEKIVKSDSRVDAKAHLDDLKVRISKSRREVTVQTEQPRDSHGRNYEVVYHVRIPRSWQISVENINGEVDIESIRSDVAIELTNGSVRLTDIWGNVDIEVINGGISGDITLPSQGICQITTVNGKIDLAIPESTSAEFSASVANGNIHISDIVLANLDTTRHLVTGTLADGDGAITLTVVNGQIDVTEF
jgi:hypothetical protein